VILPELDAWLSKSLDPTRLPATIEALAASQDDALPRELAALEDEISDCNQKLAQYRKALDSGADPAVVGRWITETQARKLAADARLRAATGTRPAPTRMTKEQIAATVTTIRDLMRALRTAAAEDKAEIYAGLNLQLTYQPLERIVNTRAEAGRTCTKGSCPRGDLNTETGEISPDRGNHAIKVTRAGPAYPAIR
jgi:site-specific DNA recombinase